MEATAQQQLAITTCDRALLVEAGAGTGKTWVLVQRFLYLLERNPDWPLESLVAITFTEKAAREMRSRIRLAIEERARQAPQDSLWQARRRALERLQVSTIHSLCARLLRENAIAAAVDPRFSVLDEQEALLLKEEAIQQTLAELARLDSPVLALLPGLYVRDLSSEMADLLKHRGTLTRLFAALPPKEALLARWQEGLAAMRQAIWQECLTTVPGLQSALEDLPQLSLPAASDKLVPIVEEAIEGCRQVGSGKLPDAAARWCAIRLNVGSQANWGGKEALKEVKELLKCLREAGQHLEKCGCTREIGPQDEQAAEALQLWRELWEALNGRYERAKQERNALDFDDLELLAWQLLEQEPRSDRLRAFLEGINHLMVDEFQDTNEIQQRIVYALAPPAAGGRLFVVGDAKQSIYRFRQAQVAIFNRTGVDIQRLTGAPPLPLNRSFRTHERLLRALNVAFDRIFRPSGLQAADYEARSGPLAPQRAAPPPHPLAPAPVELHLIPAEGAAGQAISAEQARLWEAQLLGERLLALHEGRFPVWDREAGRYRPFVFDDAAILFRATTSLPLYEERFKEMGLPYLTISGHGYYDRPEVRDLLALLACLHNPHDDLSLATVLRSPLFALSDETLYRLRWHRSAGGRGDNPIPFVRALAAPPPSHQPEEIRFAATLLQELWGMAGRTDLWRLLRHALDRTGYEATLLLADRAGGGRQYNNVQKFLELARERGGSSLSDFLLRVRELRAQEAREGEALAGGPGGGAVQLMSIHAAKGLEFPVVAVADLARHSRAGNRAPLILHDPAFGLACKLRDENGDWQKPAGYLWAEWLHGCMEAAESKRLLYVACTRAADLLLLSGRQSKQSCWLNDLLEAWELSAEGEPEEMVEGSGFELRVLRHATRSIERLAPAQPPTESLGLTTVPPLAAPLAPASRGPIPPRAPDSLPAAEREAGEPVLHPASEPGQSQRAPAACVSAVLHRVLARWDSLPAGAELERQLLAQGRQEGLQSPSQLADLVGQAHAALAALRATSLFEELDRAAERHSNLPFTLETPKGRLHGTIDLLYQDAGGGWHLVEWHYEWRTRDGWTAAMSHHRRQLALRARAVQQVLGTLPAATLCLLAPPLRVRHFEREALYQEWQRLTEGAKS